MSEGLREKSERELALQAKEGDKEALAELRRRGYFLRRREESAPSPLSHSQRRLWLLERQGVDAGAYTLPSVYRIAENLDPNILAKAFAWLTARHGQLRVHFSEEGGVPRQTVESAASFSPPFEIHDAMNSATALTEIRVWTKKGFNLDTAPLWRAGWWPSSQGGGFFAWVFHHAIADEWTLDLLADELSDSYVAFLSGGEPDLPVPGLSYFDWAASEAAVTGGTAGLADQDWWLANWLPFPPTLNLPVDHPRPTERSFAGAVAEVEWDDELIRDLSQLARRERVTPFSLALALTRLFLFRLCGQSDLMIGFPNANRDAAGADGVAGFMANTLALRREVDPCSSFLEQLRHERDLAAGALARGGYPFDLLVENAAPPRDPSRSPVFDVMLTLRAIGGGVSTPKLPAGFIAVAPGFSSARFDLAFEWKETAGCLTGLDLTYATSLFKQERIRLWLTALRTLVLAALENPELAVGDLPLLDATGRETEINAARGAERTLPWRASGESALNWFWKRTQDCWPDHPAVEDSTGVWSFRELDEMSRRSAAALVRAGLKPGDRVISALPRSRRLAAVLWGIWRAGGIYVPVDRAWPDSRKRFVLENAGGAFAVADAGDIGMPEGISLNPDAFFAENAIPGQPDNWATDGLAYLIYTSGSTGTPKGVAVKPEGVVNMALAQAEAFGIDESDRALALASCSFDASIAEMLAGWAAGACVVMAPNSIGAETLAEWLPRSGVNLLTITPALLSHLPAEAFTRARILLTAGEAARAGDLGRLPTGLTLFNAYGPTENSVCATLWKTSPKACSSDPEVPIGKPISNVNAYVLDLAGQLCLPDTPGELHLGGIGLAAGYLNRPDLTAAAFKPNRWLNNELLYATGDRVRRRADGALVFLGRVDDQVKIRGVRIEPGEVANALEKSLPGVATAILVHRDADGEAELVALVAGDERDIEQARRGMAEILPQALRPGRYVPVKELPRDANGKVDRHVLSGLLAGLNDKRPNVREPSLPFEKEVLDAWRSALGNAALNLSDDYFRSGGHSLSSLRAAALSAEYTGLTVTGRDVLLYPTAEALARHLAERSAASQAVKVELTSPSHLTGSRLASRFERLEHRIARGEIPPLDAAALGYFPDRPPPGFPEALWTRERVLADWCGGRPTLLHVFDTCFGRTGMVALPLFHTNLFSSGNRVMAEVEAGLALARTCGARTVALTGMLPPITGGGREVVKRFPHPEWPLVTHGHATTASALLLGAAKLLAAAGREWRDSAVGFLGLGSIGGLAARMAMELFPNPRRIILADLPSRHNDLEALADSWRRKAGGNLDARILSSGSRAPDAWYEADLQLCAVGVGELVDISRLRPGTLLADDSAPPCFSWSGAAERMRRFGDVLTVESGDLELPEKWRRVSYRPPELAEVLTADGAGEPDTRDSARITSCVLSGLLLAAGLADCPQMLGEVAVATALAHWRTLDRLGIKAPAFRCGAERPSAGTALRIEKR